MTDLERFFWESTGIGSTPPWRMSDRELSDCAVSCYDTIVTTGEETKMTLQEQANLVGRQAAAAAAAGEDGEAARLDAEWNALVEAIEDEEYES